MFSFPSNRCGATLALLVLATAQGCCSGGVWGNQGRNAIADRYPLGSINRAHYHQMETNAEATDFVFNRLDFVGDTSELTSDGKDHLLEIGARMRSAPFPVVVERSENNSNPDLDAERRNAVAQYLAGLGNPDAEQRTFVATPYDRGYNSIEGQMDYATYYSFRNYGGFGMGGMGNMLGFGGIGGFGGAFGGGFGGSGFGFGP